MRRYIAALLALVCVTLLCVTGASARTISYPADGWLPAGAAFSWQHPDQGRDFVTNWRGVVQAPGKWCVVAIGSDRPYPNGFGPDFAIVRVYTGPFASPLPWYLGHTSALVHEGQCGGFGAPLARADQGHPSDIGISVPGDGGWVELGQQQPSGILGPNNGDAGHWYDGLLRQTLHVTVPDPPLAWGQRSWRVWGMSNDLAACGWLDRAWYEFNQPVHGAVVAFKKRHRLPLPKHGDRGIVDAKTRKAIAKSGNTCRRTHHRESWAYLTSSAFQIPLLGAP